MDVQLFSIRQVRDQITQAYAPVNLANVDDFAIRLVKFQGEFERWHAHDDEDESFIVLEGEILFQTETGNFLLSAHSRGLIERKQQAMGDVRPRAPNRCDGDGKTPPPARDDKRVHRSGQC